MSKSIILRANALCRNFVDGALQVDVLKGLSLDVFEGECVAIMGSSGSGKSTMLQCLGGLDLPTSGEVSVCGCNIFAGKERDRAAFRNQNLGFIYQFHHLLPEFDALENVMMPLLIRGEKAANSAKASAELLDLVGLSHRLKHRINELSGGERQRVAIARALVGKPKCILADEPTGNLDQSTADSISQLLLSLNRELNTSMIVVTHNLELAGRMHRKLFLADGRLHSA